jgi:hypothetical protein
MPPRRHAALVLSLIALAAGSASAQQDPGPVQLSTPIAPTPVPTDDGTVLAWELHVENRAGSDVAVDRIRVRGDGDRLQTLEAERLESDMLIVSGTRRPLRDADAIPVGGWAVVYLWWSDDAGHFPEELVHEVDVSVAEDVGPRKDRISSDPISVDSRGSVILAPPLSGRNWLAANGPANDSPHRRAIIAAGGEPMIAQRFAIDFVQVIGESTFDGDAENNAAYHAYGAEILAVADGVVASSHDGIIENVPGLDSRAVEITLETVAGNHVILDLGDGRYAFYAHLQPGSLRVGDGDSVRVGDVLGLVGNSGNSTEPHLHFHVSNGNSPLGSEGLPYLFTRYLLQDRADASLDVPPSTTDAPRTNRLPTGGQIVEFPRR